MTPLRFAISYYKLRFQRDFRDFRVFRGYLTPTPRKGRIRRHR